MASDDSLLTLLFKETERAPKHEESDHLKANVVFGELAEDDNVDVGADSITARVRDDAELRASLDEYLAQLTSRSVEVLGREPARLEAEATEIQSSMEQLAFRNYTSFIETADCVHAVSHSIREINNDMDATIGSLPQLVATCNAFARDGRELMKARTLNKQTLSNHAQLLELLEIPQLLDTCVSNGFYDEALELESFAQRLQQMHPRVAIINVIARQVRESSRTLVAQLHQKLCGNVQLPMCMKVIGYLKRLNVYTDRQLRAAFLSCRNVWFQSIIDAVPFNGAYAYLSRVAEASRTPLFDIITQYRAIFAPEGGESRGGGKRGANKAKASSSKTSTTSTLTSGGDGGGTLLSSWLTEKVSDFIALLERHLPEVKEGASLATLLDQCMYYGMLVGRNGVDFRGLLPPLFEAAVYSLFANNMKAASAQFVRAMDACTKLESTAPPSSLSATSAHANLDTIKSSFAPPSSLMNFAAAAQLGNACVSALNELRQCAPYSVQHRCATSLVDALGVVVECVRLFRQRRALDADEEAAYEDLCEVMRDALIPHVARCFDAIFHASGASVLDTRLLTSRLDACL